MEKEAGKHKGAEQMCALNRLLSVVGSPTTCIAKDELNYADRGAYLTSKHNSCLRPYSLAEDTEQEEEHLPFMPSHLARSSFAFEQRNKKSHSFTTGTFSRRKCRPPSLFLTPAHLRLRCGQKTDVISSAALRSHSSNACSCEQRPTSLLRTCKSPLVSLSEDRSVLFAGPFSVSRHGCLTMQNVLLLNPENGQNTNCRMVSFTEDAASSLLSPELAPEHCDCVKNGSFTLLSASMNTPYSPITYSQKAFSLPTESWRENRTYSYDINSVYTRHDKSCSPLFDVAEMDSLCVCSAHGSLDVATVSAPRNTEINLTQKSSLFLHSNVVSFDDILIKSLVGNGASASVFSAEHVPTGKPLAVKRIDLSPLFSQWDFPDTSYTQRLQSATQIRQLEHVVVRELQALHVAYRSPFMAKVYNAFFLESSMSLDFVMEYMHYGSLDSLLKLLRVAGKKNKNSGSGSQYERGAHNDNDVGRGVEVPERLVAVVGEQLLRGVDHMHKRGYIHRDIKPCNVLINDKGIVKLSDFGLSQWCSAPDDHARAKRTMPHVVSGSDREEFTSFFARNNSIPSDYVQCSGTSKYMSPERQRGKAHGKPSDIWAVGMTLAEFAVGEYPVDLTDCVDAFDRVYRIEAPLDLRRFKRVCPLSEEFFDFIHVSMLPEPNDRPTASELLEHPFFRQWDMPFSIEVYLRQVSGA